MTRAPRAPACEGPSRLPPPHASTSPPGAAAGRHWPAPELLPAAAATNPAHRIHPPAVRSRARKPGQRSRPSGQWSQLVQIPAGVVRHIAQLLRDPKQLIVLGGAIGAAGAAGLDLPCSGSDSEIGDESVLGLARAM